MTLAVYLVGTDTGVGKTAVACQLLRASRSMGIRMVAFKPVASGLSGPGPSDPERLARACCPPLDPDSICPLRYELALAPGLAADPSRFLTPTPADHGPLEHVRRALDRLIQSTRADVVLIEGAGGLLVPMPGGTWQPQWVTELSDITIVVGRAGLGTINHTCLTIRALTALGRTPRGFVLVDVPHPGAAESSDPSVEHNAPVIAATTGISCLGTLPHLLHPDEPVSGWLALDTWSFLLAPTEPVP